MKFEIKIKNEVYDKIQKLMRNINEINKGEEIGGWLLGEWDIQKGQPCKLLLDDFIIPEQTVSKTEVDISPESMISTIKEVGIEQSNRIKAHWHIHPFGTGKTDWSNIDEDKITDFMAYEKGRDIFVFLLSSEDQIKARVELNVLGSNNTLQENIILKVKYDNLEVKRETEQEKDTLLDEIKEIVKNKVKSKKLTVKATSKDDFINYYGNWNKKNAVKEQKISENFYIYSKNNEVHLKILPEYMEFMKQHYDLSPSILCPDKTKLDGTDMEERIYIFDNGIDAREAKIEFEEELLYAEYETNEEKELGYDIPFYCQ